MTPVRSAMVVVLSVVGAGALVVACSDGGSSDTTVTDTGSADTGTADTGKADTGSADTGSADTGTKADSTTEGGADSSGGDATSDATDATDAPADVPTDTGPADTGPACFVPYGCTKYACASAGDAGADGGDSGDAGSGVVVTGATVAVGPRGSISGDAGTDGGTDAGSAGAGEALSFASGNTLVGSSSALPQGGVDRTMMLWAKVSTTPASATIFNYGSFSGNQRFGLLSASSKDYFVGEGNDVAGNKVLTDGAWHHITVTYASKVITLYVDGTLDKTQTLTVALNTTGFTFAIGTTATVAAREPFVGSVSDIRVYDRVLTTTEITNAATFVGGSANPESLRATGTGLVFWLPLHASSNVMLNRCAP